uniref:RNA polymerase subunit alpha n=1 Tax=Meringosphaera mediterranea TaxID=2837474 RepID=UPI00286A92FE|nr:RNA polymerase subunit alpha [Meringosphaera mediterranea]WLD05713.1 RNA polymerase subunit alpha [Meringosphaera mediterranea]WLD05877.1 RNA polymerase subunit alpha [Meringosphaera mediterranea]WLD06097.1 RNA polymerase subunit alpha [Meringosphaera mediterranea]
MAELKFQYTKSCVEESGNLTGHFLMPTTEPSQGLTVGNALRRVLLSNLEGTALTGINIPNAHHEFSTIEGVREDILEILLNLKQIILKSSSPETLTGRLKINGPGVITAAAIEFDQPVEILNPTHYIATVHEDLNASYELRAERGSGYIFADQMTKKYENFLNIDAVFMPVVKVNYTIKKIYVGYNQTVDSLVLEITTNGSITPEEALSQGAKKLTDWFGMLTTVEEVEQEVPKQIEPVVEPETILIEELQLPVRAYNCLKRSGINSIDDLKQYSQEEIKEIKNFGKKSAQDVFQALKDKYDIVLPSLKTENINKDI